MRKPNLARLLRGRPKGMFVASFEAGELGPELLRAYQRVGVCPSPDRGGIADMPQQIGQRRGRSAMANNCY